MSMHRPKCSSLSCWSQNCWSRIPSDHCNLATLTPAGMSCSKPLFPNALELLPLLGHFHPGSYGFITIHTIFNQRYSQEPDLSCLSFHQRPHTGGATVWGPQCPVWPRQVCWGSIHMVKRIGRSRASPQPNQMWWIAEQRYLTHYYI